MDCVLTGEPFCDPVILKCGHTFSSAPLYVWWETKQQRLCPVCRQETPADFQPITNFAVAQLGEKTEKKKDDREEKIYADGPRMFFLPFNSVQHIKLKMRYAYHNREVHRTRVLILEQIKKNCEYPVLIFGGTVVQHRRISLEFERLPATVELQAGKQISEKLVFSSQTDLDLAFYSEANCDQFVELLKSCFVVLSGKDGPYCALQGLTVRRLRVRLATHRPTDHLKVDLVYASKDRGVGFAWPDFIERTIACHVRSDGARYVMNPLIPVCFYRHLLSRGSLMESKEDRLVSSLLRRIDDQSPLQWCLLRPTDFTQLLPSEQKTEKIELYSEYLQSMLCRLDRALRRGDVVSGITIFFDKEHRTFTVPCHHYCTWASLSEMPWKYRVSSDEIIYTCTVTGDDHLFFKQFWRIFT